jgi:NAD(P)-dependent dehydrogenase (short-subunit alcohol dehydrogenase family)
MTETSSYETGGGFADRVALITGGGSGIGAATAVQLARRGAAIVIADIAQDNAEVVAKQIVADGGQAIAVRTDVGDPSQLEAAVELAVKTYGGLHHALNNVPSAKPGVRVGDIDPADWQHVINVGLNGVFYGLRYQIPAIRDAGGGSVVNVSSIAGLWAPSMNAGYGTAKHAIIGLTKTAALDHARDGVRVNAVCPAFIRTPLLVNGLPPERVEQLTKKHPIGRLGEANDVANLIVFLLSPAASFITGSAHLVDGGFTAGYRGGADTEN